MHIERLVEAVDGNDAPAVEAALAAGADVNARLRGGNTALMRAASEGRRAALQALLRGGANVRAQRDDGITALMLASFFGHVSVVSALLDWGADINAEDTHKFTALRLASSKCCFEVVRLLEQAGAVIPATAHGGAAQESRARPQAHAESTRRASEQEEHDGTVVVSTELPAEVTTSEEGTRRPGPCAEESVPPPGELSPPPHTVVSLVRAGGVTLFAVGACVVLLFAGVQRTLVRNAKGTAVGMTAPPAVDAGAQPVTPLAPPRGQEQTATAEPVAAATPMPPQRDPSADNPGNGRAAAEPVELRKAPSQGQHLAEPAVVSTAQNSAPPSQTESRLPEVKESGTAPPAEKASGVIVVTTPRDAPQSRTRQGEPSPIVAPPLSSPTPKKKVIPWP